jgi:formylglycine-generating enzyme required for sulfatase activity
MKWSKTWRWVPVALPLASGAMTGRAAEVVIPSFEATGQITFREVAAAEKYRVEWAPSPAGPWTNFMAAATALDGIAAGGAGSVTCIVPTCYRVVATLTNAPPAQAQGSPLATETLGGWEAGPVPVLAGPAAEFAIQSLDRSGRLTFPEISTAETYRVEWAPSPGGPWTNFTAAATALDEILASGPGSVTRPVPACYRVVATVTNAPPLTEGLFLVVDLAGGTSAPSYPVNYLNAVPAGGWTDEHRTSKLVLRRIPATTPDFTMGSPVGELGRFTNETLHAVTLTSDYYLGVFEVTQRQWELVTGAKPAYYNNADEYQTRPVEQVSYFEIRENPANGSITPSWPQSSQVHANSFMGKLRAKTGLPGFDLPTESQWEHACRAGTTTALNSGNNLTNVGSSPTMAEVGRYFYNGGSGGLGNPGADASAGTARVGSFLPNAWGLHDLHGNVWEWTLDRSGPYPGSVTDPKGATSGTDRVLRGGSWINEARYCRSARRDASPPGTRSFLSGFRAACAPPVQP